MTHWTYKVGWGLWAVALVPYAIVVVVFAVAFVLALAAVFVPTAPLLALGWFLAVGRELRRRQRAEVGDQRSEGDEQGAWIAIRPGYLQPQLSTAQRYANLCDGLAAVFDQFDEMDYCLYLQCVAQLRHELDRLWYDLTDDEKERAPKIPFRTLDVGI